VTGKSTGYSPCLNKRRKESQLKVKYEEQPLKFVAHEPDSTWSVNVSQWKFVINFSGSKN